MSPGGGGTGARGPKPTQVSSVRATTAEAEKSSFGAASSERI
ncbi:hypothetical protein D187_004100 [Cystobacter fuscus DSM 2262]|uniref:Uncharacterized protein n=1 Tax=Cystobacter fuscus (strain ATCC 25194 / DSM 2262 / NBRC 100088 / M29) TaxID=1242864 RepID=S9QAH8_CYSF2|nr:hypothetical protein D187_004100 [Cystobacter fuscus DSM 2262]